MIEAQSWKLGATVDGHSLDWLEQDGEARDIVVTSRARLARNLAGFPFPQRATTEQLLAVAGLVRAVPCDLDWKREVGDTERSFYLRCRMVSPEFPVAAPGRLLGIARDGNASVMVNEEDHIRAQALAPGWSPARAEKALRDLMAPLDRKLSFVADPRIGFLTASPANAGRGARISAMFHLVGLAWQNRLRPVLSALADQNVMIRGLYGEGTRPIGAFFQVSMTREIHPEFLGACEYLIGEERAARGAVRPDDLWKAVQQLVAQTISRRSVTYAEAMKVCAWVRWAAGEKLWGDNLPVSRVDAWLMQIPLGQGADSSRFRAVQMRSLIESFWMPNLERGSRGRES